MGKLRGWRKFFYTYGMQDVRMQREGARNFEPFSVKELYHAFRDRLRAEDEGDVLDDREGEGYEGSFEDDIEE